MNTRERRKARGLRELDRAYEAVQAESPAIGTPHDRIREGILLGLAFARGDEGVTLDRLLGEVR